MTTENFQMSTSCVAGYIFYLCYFHIPRLFKLRDELTFRSFNRFAALMNTVIPVPPDEDGAQYDDIDPPKPILPETPQE